MNRHYRELIADEFRNCVNNTIRRITTSEETYRPFHAALLSEDVIFWSRFERSFSTSFGQRVIEEIAKLVALSNGATDAQRQKVTNIRIDSAYEYAINHHIQHLRGQGRNILHDWDSSVEDVYSVEPTGELVTLRVISDLWWRKNGINNYMSLKTVKPNIDQTAVAKEDCLKLYVADNNANVYFGLPYNPYGEEREDYAFNPPMGIFDFHYDPVVLIGKDMWDTLGGEGCYEQLLDIAAEVGFETKRAIERMRR